MVLRATKVVTGRSGWSTMCWCEVQRRGKGEKKEVREKEKKEILEPGDQEKLEYQPTEGGDDPHEGVTENKKHDMGHTSEHDAAPRSSLIVFQPVPSECAKVGLDPRIFTHKSPSPTAIYEIGIWGPWTTTTIELEEGETSEVIFASRYLVAEL